MSDLSTDSDGASRVPSPNEVVEAYCFKCRARREMINPLETRMRNGRMAVSGHCITCGAKMFKINGMPPRTDDSE